MSGITNKNELNSKYSSSLRNLGSWPYECEQLYERIKPLGKGGFSFVWLARSRDDKNKLEENPEDDPKLSCSQKIHPEYVAVKLINAKNEVEITYANREIQALKEIKHEFIMKLIDTIDLKSMDESGRSTIPPYRCIVISYEHGPTLGKLIKHGGALGIPFTQLIFKQLASAIAYMHSRAVMHRDIKPDNIIINNADVSDDACWSDGEKGIQAAKNVKWKAKLIDFGFARILTPEQVEIGNEFLNRSIKGCSKGDNIAFGASDPDEIIVSPLQNSIGRDATSLDASISTKQIMDLSALGNRNYAAPEIIRGVKSYAPKFIKKDKKIFQTIAENVSDYGITADAFSFGATLRHALTGVPPDLDVNEYLAFRNSPISISMRMIGKMVKSFGNRKKDQNNRKRRKQFRTYEDIPVEAARVIRGLTIWNPSERTTVRAVQFYPWFQDSNNEKSTTDDDTNEPLYEHKVNYLPCAIDN